MEPSEDEVAGINQKEVKCGIYSFQSKQDPNSGRLRFVSLSVTLPFTQKSDKQSGWLLQLIHVGESFPELSQSGRRKKNKNQSCSLRAAACLSHAMHSKWNQGCVQDEETAHVCIFNNVHLKCLVLYFAATVCCCADVALCTSNTSHLDLLLNQFGRKYNIIYYIKSPTNCFT